LSTRYAATVSVQKGVVYVTRGSGTAEVVHPEHGTAALSEVPWVSMTRAEGARALNTAVRTTLATPMTCPTRDDGQAQDAWLTPTVARPYVHCSRCESPHVDDLLGMLRQVLTCFDVAYVYEDGGDLSLKVRPVGDLCWRQEHRRDVSETEKETLDLLKRKALIKTHKRRKAQLYGPG
jgi:hypothetical protein